MLWLTNNQTRTGGDGGEGQGDFSPDRSQGWINIIKGTQELGLRQTRMATFSALAARGAGRKRAICLHLQSAPSGNDHPLYIGYSKIWVLESHKKNLPQKWHDLKALGWLPCKMWPLNPSVKYHIRIWKCLSTNVRQKNPNYRTSLTSYYWKNLKINSKHTF